MTIKNYLIIENNTVSNVVFWDGNPGTWEPPKNAVTLIASETPALVWGVLPNSLTHTIVEKIGEGKIGFTWDGSVLKTNAPKPPDLKPQPIVSGMKTA